MLIDTHVHFDGLDDTPDNILARASHNEVTQMIAVGGNPSANDFALKTAATHPDRISPAIGLDRYLAEKSGENEINNLIKALHKTLTTLQTDPRPCAIGEIGLDFHYSRNTRNLQIKLFRAQLKLAAELSLPVIVHSREAEQETVDELEKHVKSLTQTSPPPGVLHCFTGSPAFARKLVKLGYYVSFSGIVTFKKAEPIRQALLAVPNDKLLIETDSPYLAPAPYRGKPNEPANVKYVAERIAEKRESNLESIARLTTENAKLLFSL